MTRNIRIPELRERQSGDFLCEAEIQRTCRRILSHRGILTEWITYTRKNLHKMNYVLRALMGLLMLSTTVFTSVGHGKEKDRLDSVAATYQNEAPKQQPILLVDNDTADLGAIKKDDIRQHNFRIINTGTAPLVIHKAYSGCHCTATEYSPDPVMPGDTTIIKVTFNSQGRGPGYFTKLVRIRTNATSHPVRLYIKGRITE